MREQAPTLTPTLSLSEGEGATSIPSPLEGEKDRVRGFGLEGAQGPEHYLRGDGL